MSKWTKGILALEENDLIVARDIIKKAKELWKEYGRDEGSCVIGAGIGVMLLRKKCRKPIEYIIINSPFQGDGSRNISIPLNYLARNGIAAFRIIGRID